MADSISGFSLNRRLISGGVWATVGQVGTALLSICIYALLARLLSPAHMGAYFLAYSLITFGAAIGMLGMNQAVVRFIAESIGVNQLDKVRGIVGRSLLIVVAGALTVSIVYILFGKILSIHLFDSKVLAAVTWLVACWIIALSMQRIIASIFRGFHDIRLASIFSGLLTGGLIVTTLGAIYVTKGHLSLAGAIIVTVLAAITSVIAAAVILKRKIAMLPGGGTVLGTSVIKLLNVSMPMLVTGLTALSLTHANILIAGAFLPKHDIAVYGAASRLVILISMPLGIVNAVIQPVIAELFFQKKENKLERLLRTTATLIGIPIFLVVLVLLFYGEFVLAFVYGDFYRKGVVVLILLCLGHMVHVWGGSCGLLLNMTGHHIQAMKITLLSAGVAITTSFATVTSFGIAGIAFATALGYAVLNMTLVIYSVRVLGIKSYMTFPKDIRSMTNRGLI